MKREKDKQTGGLKGIGDSVQAARDKGRHIYREVQIAHAQRQTQKQEQGEETGTRV